MHFNCDSALETTPRLIQALLAIVPQVVFTLVDSLGD